MTLPKSVFFVLNPEGKAFNDSVSYERHICEIEFVRSWFSGWNISVGMYEAGVVFKMFEKAGFKIGEIPLPKPDKK